MQADIDNDVNEAKKALAEGKIDRATFLVFWPREKEFAAHPRKQRAPAFESDVVRDPQGRLTSREALEAEREERRSATSPAKPGSCSRIRVRRGIIEKGE